MYQSTVGPGTLAVRLRVTDAGAVDGLRVALLVGAGVGANLLIAAMFIARVIRPAVARPLGLGGTAMAIPLGLAAAFARMDGLDVWDVVLPLVFVLFAVVEVMVDSIPDFEVRETRWLWPYLMLFYLAQWAVIGAAFRASEPGGLVVLVSYFVCLGATAYSYRRVGHGIDAGEGASEPHGVTGDDPIGHGQDGDHAIASEAGHRGA